MAAPARAEGSAVALNMGDSGVLVAPDGTELVPQGQYSNIMPLGDGAPCDFAAYGIGDQSGAVKLLDPMGKPLSDFSYESLGAIGDKICFEQDGFYGVMDRDQRVVVPCQYTSIVANGEGGYLALTTNPNDERPDGVYYIDSAGSETATGIRVLYGLTEFSNGLMPVLSAESSRTGYLNPRGELAISAQFSYAGPFTGAFADASIDSGTGLIDTSGNWLITPKYEALSLAGSGAVAVAQVDGTRIALIDTKTFQTIKEFTGRDIYFYAAPDSPLITLYLDGAMKLVNLAGNEVISSSAPDSTALCDGARVILREGPWGEKNATLCDLTGKKLAGPYQDIWRVGADGGTPYYAYSSFDTQSADNGGTTSLNEVPGTRQTGLLNQDGKVLWQPADIQEVYSPVEGLFVVETTDKVGIMKADGSWLKSYEIPSGDAE